MKRLIMSLLAVCAIALAPVQANAAAPTLGYNAFGTLSAPTALPGTFDLAFVFGGELFLAGRDVVRSEATGAGIGDLAGLVASGPAKITWTYLGSEASHGNSVFELSAGKLFDNQTSSVGDTITTYSPGGLLNFAFCSDSGTAALTGCVDNNGTTLGAANDLKIAISSILQSNKAVVMFGDGTGDFDKDDMVIGVAVSAVPLPAALPMLMAGIGLLGAARKFKS